MQNQTHIIQKQFFHLNLSRQKDAYKTQSKVINIFNNSIRPQLGEILSEFSKSNFHIQIDKLALNLGTINENNLEAELTQKFLLHFHNCLLEIQGGDDSYIDNNITIKTNEQHRIETFYFFLLKGYLPSGAIDAGIKQLEEKLIELIDETFIASLSSFLSRHSSTIERLIFQFSEKFIRKIVNECYKRISAEEILTSMENNIICLEVENIPRSEKQHIYNTIIFQLIAESEHKSYSGNEVLFPFLHLLLRSISKRHFDKFISYMTSNTIKLKSESNKVIARTIKQFQENVLLDEKIEIVTSAKSKNVGKDTIENKRNQLIEFQNLTPDEHANIASGEDIPVAKIEEDVEDISNSISKDKELRGKYNEEPNELLHINYKSIEESINKTFNLGKDTYYVNYAGIVILSPFISGFFKNCNLLEDSLFKDEENKMKAFYLLSYLASGNKFNDETQVLLIKLLCDIPFNYPVKKGISLSKTEIEESNKLLRSAIVHWKALKKTSIQGLRESFFVRDGILIRKDSRWHLRVEQKSFDMLLDQLPWGISIIKFPWMMDALYVDWG